MKKWTVEWAMKRWPIEQKGNQFALSGKRIWPGANPNNWFISRLSDNTIYAESEAVRWLIADQPRTEKKRKWVLMKENSFDPDYGKQLRFGIFGDDEKTVIFMRDGKLIVRDFKRAEKATE